MLSCDAGRWRGAHVAVKILTHSIHAHRDSILVAREALISAAASHPNVVSASAGWLDRANPVSGKQGNHHSAGHCEQLVIAGQTILHQDTKAGLQ